MSDLGNTQKISSAVFFPALAVVILTLTSLIFPALFSSYFGMFGENLNPFESNNYSIFVIVSNVLIFGFGIAYYKKKIPSSFYNVFEKVRIFEISKRDFNSKNNLYKYTSFRWRISGKREEVIRDNGRTIRIQEIDYPGISKILSPLQLWKPPKNSAESLQKKLLLLKFD